MVFHFSCLEPQKVRISNARTQKTVKLNRRQTPAAEHDHKASSRLQYRFWFNRFCYQYGYIDLCPDEQSILLWLGRADRQAYTSTCQSSLLLHQGISIHFLTDFVGWEENKPPNLCLALGHLSEAGNSFRRCKCWQLVENAARNKVATGQPDLVMFTGNQGILTTNLPLNNLQARACWSQGIMGNTRWGRLTWRPWILKANLV